MKKKLKLVKAIEWTLAIMLSINFVFSLLIVRVNPEAWFFGHKFGGVKAIGWLLTNGVVGVAIGFSIIQKWNHSLLASLVFFAYNLANIMLIPFPQPVISPFFLIGLTISFVGMVMKNLMYNR